MVALLWSIVKNTSRPLHSDLTDIWDWPNTVTYLVALRQRYDSYLELSEVPPEEHWDFPRLIQLHIEKLYPSMKNKSSAEVDITDIEG